MFRFVAVAGAAKMGRPGAGDTNSYETLIKSTGI